MIDRIAHIVGASSPIQVLWIDAAKMAVAATMAAFVFLRRFRAVHLLRNIAMSADRILSRIEPAIAELVAAIWKLNAVICCGFNCSPHKRSNLATL